MEYKVSIGWGNDFIFTSSEDAAAFIKLACENKAPDNDSKIYMEVLIEEEGDRDGK